jgi:hypothetical protein
MPLKGIDCGVVAGAWINPMPATLPDSELAARIDMRVQDAEGNRYTLNYDVSARVGCSLSRHATAMTTLCLLCCACRTN